LIALIAATDRGRAQAVRLERLLPGSELISGRPGEGLRRAWGEADAIVCFLAVGAVVRLIAPLLEDKRRDPGVVCVDDAGRFAVAVAGGHEGGANALAERVAAVLGAAPVVTTASDTLGVPALDSLGSELGFRLDPASSIAAVGAAMLDGHPVRLVCERRWPMAPLPPNVRPDADADAPSIVISDLSLTEGAGASSVVYRPPSLVVGVGCSRGARAGEILGLIDEVLAVGGLAAESVAAIASIDVKADEPGLVAAAEQRGWPLELLPAELLAEVRVPNPSRVVARAVGTPSVAEAAALAVAARPASVHDLDDPPELVVAKRKSPMATAAVARRPIRGRLALVSIGPGDDGLLAPLAAEALRRAQVVVGYGPYLDQVAAHVRPGARIVRYELGEELERCRFAIEQASGGASVALVSSGDVGVYAMASPALEAGGLGAVDVECVPGVTAAHAAAALVGSPLGHDHCSISLSDLLTPWEVILERIGAAAQGDFVISFYNPRSRRRDWQLEAARELLLEHRPAHTPVALVTDAFRPGQRVVVSTLAEFDAGQVGMTTLVIVGSSQTRLVEGRMVTPRGYAVASVLAGDGSGTVGS
jgi:cobalt-precorrin 5A hydrolase/precorrin-3B C17-methyltransferase